MNIISKRQFDERVKEIYTSDPDHTQNYIAKSSHEAYIKAIENLIIHSRNRSILHYCRGDMTIYHREELHYLMYSHARELAEDIIEPVYIIIDRKICDYTQTQIFVRSLQARDLLHGLILINYPQWAYYSLFETLDYKLSVTELHIFHSTFIEWGHPEFKDMNLDSIRHIGLHGHSSHVWNELGLGRYNIPEISMRAIGTVDRFSGSDTIVVTGPIRILDVELTDDMRDNRESIYNGDGSLDLSQIEYCSMIYGPILDDNIFSDILQSPHVNTIRVIGKIPSVKITRPVPSLIELDLIFTHRVMSRLPLSRFSNLTTLKIHYDIEGSLRIPNLKKLKILHMTGSIKKYQDNFNIFSNVTELNISSIPESIYNMPSLKTLTISGASRELLLDIEYDKLITKPEIILYEHLLENKSIIEDYISEHSDRLDEKILALLQSEVEARII